MRFMSSKLYTILTLPLAQEPPALWVIKFTFFSEPFLARHYFKPNLSASCSRVENIRRRNVAFSLHGLFGNIGPRLNTGPGKYQNYNFGRPSLGHLYYMTVCLIHAWSIWLIMTSPRARTLDPGVMKFTIFVGPSLLIITINSL